MQKKIEPQVVEAERAHCRLLAEALDEAGGEMIRKYWGIEPAEGLERSFEASSLCWTILVNGRVAGMFGCAGGKEGGASCVCRQ